MFLKSSPTSLAKLALLVAIITLVVWLTLDGNQIARSAFIFLLILGGLVFVHELAHFVTARLFQIRVEEFAVGMPPRILSVERGGTRYSLNFLPLGGYVKMEGEEHNTSSDSFAAKPAWQRLIVLGAGGITNLLVPIILFAIALIIPHEVAEGRAVVAGIVPSGPAASAGVEEGDLISIREKARSQLRIQGALALSGQRAAVEWVSVDTSKLEGLFKSYPDRDELPKEINENLIVELYSK